MVSNFAAVSVRLPRITAVSVLLELKLDTLNAAKLPYLFDCYGVVSRVKRGNDGKGPWVRFEGKFVAETADRIEFHSKRCHLPIGVQGELAERWDAVSAADPDVQLQIAVRVSVVSSGAIASYVGVQLMPAEAFNELNAVRERVARYKQWVIDKNPVPGHTPYDQPPEAAA